MEGSLVNGVRLTKGKKIAHISPVTQKEWTTLNEINDQELEEALRALEVESLQ